jgi:hypothetical protein
MLAEYDTESSEFGIKCCSTLFPGELLACKKRCELYATKVALVDYAGDFNRKVVAAVDSLTTARRTLGELDAHLRLLSHGEYAPDVGESGWREEGGLAELIIKSEGGGEQFWEEWVESLPTAVVVEEGDRSKVESCGSFSSVESPSVLGSPLLPEGYVHLFNHC